MGRTVSLNSLPRPKNSSALPQQESTVPLKNMFHFNFIEEYVEVVLIVIETPACSTNGRVRNSLAAYLQSLSVERAALIGPSKEQLIIRYGFMDPPP